MGCIDKRKRQHTCAVPLPARGAGVPTGAPWHILNNAQNRNKNAIIRIIIIQTKCNISPDGT